MKYYEMVDPWEPEIIGVKDGLAQARVLKTGFKNEINYNIFEEHFVNKRLIPPHELPAINFELECVKLRKGAKLTDFLMFSPKTFWLVSAKVSSILASRNLAPHKLFPATIEDSNGKKIDGYSFLYMPPFEADHILFNESRFKTGNKYAGYKDVSINSPGDLLSVNGFLVIEKVALTEVSYKFDMLRVLLPMGSLISESLYEDLTAANVSGMKFREIEIVF